MNSEDSTTVRALLDIATALMEKVVSAQGDDWKIHAHATACILDQCCRIVEASERKTP